MSLLKFPITGLVTRVKGKTAAGIGMFGALFVGSPINSPTDAPATGDAFGIFKTSGVPTNGTSGTYANEANPGSILVDVAGTGSVWTYINTNTKASPTWTAQPVTSGAASFTTGTFTGDVLVSETQSSTTPAAERLLDSEFTLSGATITPGAGSGSLAGIRGNLIIGVSSTAENGFYYGVQGKLTISGTMNAPTGWLTGLLGQLDLSTATLTAGNLSTIWGDAGATGPAVSATHFDLLRLTNSTATTGNSHLFTFGKAAYWAQIDDNNHGSGFYAAAGTSAGSAGDAAHAAAQQVLKVYINGAAAYIPVFTQNS